MTSNQSDIELGEDWRNRLQLDRPIYDCPECKKLAMQYYMRSEEFPGRENFYYCYACGSLFEI